MSKEIYRCYGRGSFNKHLFQLISNSDWGNKPNGGLWSSPTKDVDISWYDWCKGEGFFTDRLNEHFDFVLKDNARVLVLKNKEDVDNLPTLKSVDDCYITKYASTIDRRIDFETLSKDYDAIMVWMYRRTTLPEKDSVLIFDSMYHWLYGWDVDTLLVLNPDVIEVIK